MKITRLNIELEYLLLQVVLELNLMTVVDPVCGMPVDPEKSEFKVDI